MITFPSASAVSQEDQHQDNNHDQQDVRNGSSNFETENQNSIAEESSSKKRKSIDMEPTPLESINKKPHLDEEVLKELPDLEKYWLAVDKDPTDFTAWTHLLQFVDQLDKVELAREAYDSFLGRYPYCYGYWKKYADYEKRQSNTDVVVQVFERGIKAIPLSVDLWIHYINFMRSIESDVTIVSSLLQKAISSCGLEYRSDKLWEVYISWTIETGNLKEAVSILDRVIKVPTQSHAKQFERFIEFVSQHDPSEFLTPEEYEMYYLEAKAHPNEGGNLTSDIKNKFIRSKEVVYARNVDAVKIRLPYEEAIKRPYFHVKPVEKNQLKVWKDYLNFEIEKGDMSRILTLFERCLIACAMYPEYWQMYLKFLITNSKDVSLIRDVFHRVCAIHQSKNQFFKLDWATFEEKQGDLDAVRSIFDSVRKDPSEEVLPPFYYRHINFERRQNNFEKAKDLFEFYISKCKSKVDATHLTIKFARFIAMSLHSFPEAIRLLQNVIENDESTKAKVIMCIVDLGMQCKPMDFDNIISAFDYGIKNFTKDQKITFAQRKLEFLEEFGTGIEIVQEADDELQGICKSLREDYLAKIAPKPESKIPTLVEPIMGDVNSMPSSGVPAGYDSYSSAYGEQYNSAPYDQYSGSWSGPPPAADPTVYSQTYSNNPTGWNSYYA